jgi:ApaG protein
MNQSEVVTQGIRVSVVSEFVPQRSEPESDIYFFAYQITIQNEGTESAQLISRHWIITDAENHVEEVKGLGVVGEQPLLGPGASHQYTSFCPLKTPFGTMKGSFQMVTDDGTFFDVSVAPFQLSLEKEMMH